MKIQLSFLFCFLVSLSCFGQECELFNLNYEITECSGQEVMVAFDFSAANVGNSGFSVVHNQGVDFGDFEYGELFYEVGPFDADCITDYVLIINDNEFPACALETEIGSLCCQIDSCEMNIPIAEVHSCNEGTFLIDFELNVENPGSEGFLVAINNELLGPFEYGQTFYTIGPFEADCQNGFNMVAFDKEFSYCSSEYLFEPVCCGCAIGEIETNTGICNGDSTFFLNLNFSVQSPLSNEFDLFLNGSPYGTYDYENLPINLTNIPDQGELAHELQICDSEDPQCCNTVQIYSPCVCGMANISYNISACQNDSFYISLDFIPGANGSDGFTVGGNGNVYGTYDYEALPIELGPFHADNSTPYEFIFIDLIDPLCFEFIDIGQISCEEINNCNISNVNAIAGNCSADNSFYAYISFDVANPGSDGFTIQGNGTNYGNFSYGENIYPVGPLSGDCNTIYEFVIIDLASPICQDFTAFENPICCNSDCEIWDISVDPLECTGDGTYALVLDFNVQGNTNQFFDVFSGNEFVGFYAYSELPLTILDFPERDAEYDLIRICDNDNPDCCAVLEFMGLDCSFEECIIDDLFIEAGECDGNLFLVDLTFFVSGTTSDSFKIVGNGLNHGTFAYGQDFYTVGPLEGDCETIYEFVVMDSEFEGCMAFAEFEEPICCETDCEIWDITVDPLECTGEGTYALVLDFNVQGNTNEFFDVFSGNEFVGFYAYSELPLTILDFPERDAEYDLIKICDNDNPDCCAVLEFMGLDCSSEDCIIDDLFIEAGECDGNLFLVDLTFFVSGTTSDSFKIVGNGLNHGTFAYGQDFYTVGPLEGDCETIYEFVVMDAEIEGCMAFAEFENPICCDSDCEIWDITVDPLECTGEGTYALVLDFNVQGNTNQFFDVFSGNEFVGFYAYSELPLTILDFPERDAEYDLIRICDNDNPDCCAVLEFMGLDCSSEDCIIDDLFIEAGECDGNLFLVDLTFFVSETTSDSFKIVGNGLNHGTFAYGQDFYTVGPLEGDCETIYEFVVMDAEMEECMAFAEFEEPICCETDATNDVISEHINWVQKESEFSIQSDVMLELNISIYNLIGQAIYRTFSEGNHWTVPVSDIHSGIYILELQSGHSRKAVKIYIP